MQIGKAARSNGSHIKSRLKMEPHGVFKEVTKQCTNKDHYQSVARPFYYRILGLAPVARPRREHFVFVFFVPGKPTSNWLPALKIGLNAT